MYILTDNKFLKRLILPPVKLFMQWCLSLN